MCILLSLLLQLWQRQGGQPGPVITLLCLAWQRSQGEQCEQRASCVL